MQKLNRGLQVAVFSCLVLIALSAARGQVYLFLVVDPATTAGAGVPPAGGFTVTSTKSGPGSFHLFAVDDVDGSYGLSVFRIQLNGTFTATTLLNRSSWTNWDDVDNNGPYPEGFSDIRSGSPANPLTAVQGLSNSPFITGFGQSASNFAAKTTGAASYFSTVSGQWGNYADPYTSGTVLATGHSRNAFFLAEGTYTGSPPTIDLTSDPNIDGTVVRYWIQNPNSSPTGIYPPSASANLVNANPFLVPEPTTLLLLGVACFAGLFVTRRQR
jgi:hypothetical protein